MGDSEGEQLGEKEGNPEGKTLGKNDGMVDGELLGKKVVRMAGPGGGRRGSTGIAG